MGALERTIRLWLEMIRQLHPMKGDLMPNQIRTPMIRVRTPMIRLGRWYKPRIGGPIQVFLEIAASGPDYIQFETRTKLLEDGSEYPGHLITVQRRDLDQAGPGSYFVHRQARELLADYIA